jgi:hypothetical protein
MSSPEWRARVLALAVALCALSSTVAWAPFSAQPAGTGVREVASADPVRSDTHPASPTPSRVTSPPASPSVTETPSWVNLTATAGAPAGILDPLIAYDPARDAIVLTGGTICYSFADSNFGCFKGFISNFTWQYSGGRWTNVSNLVGPSPLTAGNGYYEGWLAYDAHDACLVLWTYLGETYPSYLDFPQTWTLGSGRWTNVTHDSPNQPGTQGWPVYDPVDSYLIDYTSLGTTWRFSGNIWTDLGNWSDLSGEPAAAAPPYNYIQQSAFDPPDARVVLYGFGPSAGLTWTFVNGEWHQLNTTGQTPPGVASIPLFYDAALGGLVYYGGDNSSEDGPPAPATTWLYVNENWTNITSTVGVGPPSPFLWGGQSAEYPQGGYALVLTPLEPTTWPNAYTWALTDRPIPALSVTPSTTETNETVVFVTQTSGGVGPMTYRFSALPPDCAASPSGDFACSMGTVGSFIIGLNVTDADGLTGNTTAVLQVLPHLDVSVTASPTALDLGQEWTLDVRASGGRSAYTYAYSGLPPGCSTKLSTLLCTPTVDGVFAYHVVVTDQLGIQVSVGGSVTVDPDLGVLLNLGANEVEVNETDPISWTVFGGTGPYEYFVSGLPPGCGSNPAPPIQCRLGAVGTYRIALTTIDATGQEANTSALINVVPRLSVVGFFIWSRTTVPLGTSLLLGTNLSGGVGARTYDYTGLPPGCVSQDNYSIACVPSATGSWVVEVHATDARGVVATANLTVTVTPASGVALSALDWGLIGVGLAVIVLAVAVVSLGRRRRAEPPDADPPDPR